MERWKPIENYPHLYEVSSLGRVKSLERITSHGHFRHERILKGNKTSQGYIVFGLGENNKKKYIKAHRLVANAFIPNPENKLTVNHINGIKHDNRLENLEWATNSENSQHAYDIGLQHGRKGEKHHLSKLKKQDVLKIRANKNKLSQVKLSEKYNISKSLVSMIINNVIWKHI